ncbi:restriction endonuclease subunit S [Gelidibacter sp. F2691]|nr:restriction endonuclease subunit S [Gelidibacter sp. F2691]
MSYKKLGDFIRKVDVKNKDGKVLNLQGLSMIKEFRKSTSNIIGTDLSKYKIVKNGQFCCDFMSVIRVHKLPVVLNNTGEDVIISPAYVVFEVIDKNLLLPEYLMMWFRRSEFDRYADFRCDSSIRGGFQWDELGEVELPVPSIEKQRNIVAQYQSITNKIKVNEQICEKLEASAQALYKQWFVDFEFPNEEGNSYKSSGGMMVWNEELDMEIPEGWNVGTLSELCEYSNKRISINKVDLENYISTENLLPNKSGVISASSLPSVINVTSFEIGNILISNIRPYFKKIWLANCSGGCSNDVLCFVSKSKIPHLYLYQTLERDCFFDYVMAGSKGTKMPRGDKNWIMNYPIIIPNSRQLNDFSRIVRVIQTDIQLRKKQNQKLVQFQSLLLSRLATLEE